MVGHSSFEGTGSSSPYSSQNYGGGRSQYNDVSTEDIFNMFFTGQAPQNFRRRQQQQYRKTRSDNSRNRATHEDEDKNKVGLQFLIQLLPVIFMLLLSFTSMSGGTNLPNASLTKKGRFQHNFLVDVLVPQTRKNGSISLLASLFNY